MRLTLLGTIAVLVALLLAIALASLLLPRKEPPKGLAR